MPGAVSTLADLRDPVSVGPLIRHAKPAVEFNLAWKRLNVYYEGEYIIDLDDDEGNFLFGWAEVTGSPLDSGWQGRQGQDP